MYPLAVAWTLLLVWKLLALRRWFSIPTFHGPEYFFDARVPAGFYDGDGRALVRRYRKLMVTPLLLELPLSAVVGIWSGWDFRLLLGIGLFFSMAGLWRIRTIKRFAKEAYGQIGYAQQEAPPAPVTLSMAPRDLKEYRSAAVEWSVRGMLATGLGLSVYAGLRDGSQADWPALIAFPLTFSYLLFGVRLVQKHLVTARLLRLPPGDPEKYLAFREDYRRHWLRMADLIRLLLALPILMGGVQAALPPNWGTESTRDYLYYGPIWASLLGLLIGVSRLTSQFGARMKALGPPAQRPRPIPEPAQTRGFAAYFCWEKGLPGIIVRGEKHALFNLGSGQTRTYAAYLAGWAVLVGLSLL